MADENNAGVIGNIFGNILGDTPAQADESRKTIDWILDKIKTGNLSAGEYYTYNTTPREDATGVIALPQPANTFYPTIPGKFSSVFLYGGIALLVYLVIRK